MRKVDSEIRKIIDQQYAVARKLIEDNRDKVEAMAKALLELETIDADQIDDIMSGRPPRPPKPSGFERPGPRRRARRSVRRRRRRRIPPENGARGEQEGVRGRPVCRRDRVVVTRDAPLRPAHARARRPRVMGILNVTPDSFYDGGRHGRPRTCDRPRAADGRGRRDDPRRRRRVDAPGRRGGPRRRRAPARDAGGRSARARRLRRLGRHASSGGDARGDRARARRW